MVGGFGYVRHRCHRTRQRREPLGKGIPLSPGLFKRGHISLIHYTITKDNDVAMYGEVDDETAYERAFQSSETMKAMEEDGVVMNTVKTFRLDKEIKPS
jgi:hypothetical protein